MKSLDQSPREPAFVQDPYPFYDHSRDAGPLFHWTDYGFACSSQYGVVNALLRDRRFGRELPEDLRPARPKHLSRFHAIDDLSMLDREPPAHTRLRRLVLRAFTSRRIAALGPEVRQLATTLIDGLDAGEFDLLPDFGEPLPSIVIAHLLGVPEESAPQLVRWSHDMVALYQARRDTEVEQRAEIAASEFSSFIESQIGTRRVEPRDDLITHLIAAEAEGDHLSREELVATCILLLNAGHEATVHAIGNGVRAMLLSRVDPAMAFRDRESVDRTIEEVLRFDAPLHMFTRFALEDVEAFGHAFGRGEKVGLLLAAANRDPARFPEPDVFRIDRDPAPHLSLGAGIHFCLGAPLARLELSVALPMLFERLPGLRFAAEPVFADRYHFRGLKELRLSSRS